ncbi:hypothetical protein L7F22_009703 [Adiantum nelumboides]|nr:hypothetical protein [Adiantum nelumboides]
MKIAMEQPKLSKRLSSEMTKGEDLGRNKLDTLLVAVGTQELSPLGEGVMGEEPRAVASTTRAKNRATTKLHTTHIGFRGGGIEEELKAYKVTQGASEAIEEVVNRGEERGGEGDNRDEQAREVGREARAWARAIAIRGRSHGGGAKGSGIHNEVICVQVKNSHVHTGIVVCHVDGMQHVSTAVQGTIGYLDPEYFQTLQLTDKSDVYSLGVMLVELISGLKPVDSRTREPRFTNLALLFINHMQEARGEDLIDPCLVEPSTLSNDESLDVMMVRSSIMAVADLAHQCLALHGDERPSMSLLVDELRRIARALRDARYDEDTVNDYHLRPLNKHGEAGAVISQDAEFFVKSTSSTISISNLNAPTMPR